MARRKLPLAPTFSPADVASAAQAATLQAMAQRRSVARAAELGADAGDWAAELGARVMERIAPSSASACRDGCAFCCHLKIIATAPEVLRLSEHLLATRAPAELAAIRDRVSRADDRTRGMTTDQRARAKLACPLLEGGRCAAYEARPLACRGANSLDAARCERGFERPEEDVELPIYKPQLQLTEALRGGLSGGLARAGLDGRPLELNAALRIALVDAEACKDWSRGKPALAAAVDGEMEEAARRARGGP
ncbi:MAG: YkgJ family cysteine cluster protein [Polyangiaceae bacterium]|nr:YkgJ family cysteine cluster protein [Polyangiaceae bacterium]